MDTHDTLAHPIFLSAAAFAAAAFVHWSLGRLAKRLPRWQARRRSQNGHPLQIERAEHLLALALLPLRIGAWVVAVLFVADQFPGFRSWRQMFLSMAREALMGPLFDIDGRTYSFADVIELPALVGGVWLLASAFTHLLRTQVLAHTGMNRGVQETITLLTRYAVTGVGTVIVLQSWGLDVRSLALAFSVLGVGIGFGLQNIANNFVSGLVINFERPIQPGHFVRVGEWTGTVERIGGRSTLIRTLDQVAILVPNSRLLESEVINWSHGDPLSRLHVAVGVAYGSNLRAVRETLLEVAHLHPDVLKDPKPRVELRRFGDSSLDFELLVWSRDPRSHTRLISDLNFRIAYALKSAAIQIPFPQRDLNLRSPQLEQLLSAWGTRTFSQDELAAAEAALHEAIPPKESFVDDSGPASWSDAQVDAVAARLRSSTGVAVLDRRHLFKTYPQCFIGREAVDWLVQNEDLTRCEAVAFGEILVRRGTVRHVLDEHGFEDSGFFYSFEADESDQKSTQ